MRRTLFLTYALLFALLVHAEGYSFFTHNFNTAAGSTPATIKITNKNTIGTMSDETVYTCYGSAKFMNADGSQPGAGICIEIPQNDSVIVSPPIERLSHMDIAVIPGYDSLDVYVSLDKSAWTIVPVSRNASLGTASVEPATLYGNYYVKLVAKPARKNAYLKWIKYYTHPDCGCFPYVPEL